MFCFVFEGSLYKEFSDKAVSGAEVSCSRTAVPRQTAAGGTGWNGSVRRCGEPQPGVCIACTGTNSAHLARKAPVGRLCAGGRSFAPGRDERSACPMRQPQPGSDLASAGAAAAGCPQAGGACGSSFHTASSIWGSFACRLDCFRFACGHGFNKTNSGGGGKFLSCSSCLSGLSFSYSGGKKTLNRACYCCLKSF